MNIKAINYFLLLLILGILSIAPLYAAQPAWPQKPVSLNAQERPLNDFIKDFFGSIGIIATVSPSVSGKISGQFDGDPQNVFNDIVKAYSLLSYYDGSVMHISTATEIQSKKLTVNPKKINDFIRLVDRLDLRDSVHTIKVLSEKGVVHVRGTPEFISDVEDVVLAIPDLTSIKPEPLRYPTSQGSSQKRKLVFRTFQLQYASAGDVTLYQNGREVTVPGVVTLLRNLVGTGGYSSTQPYTSGYTPNRVPDVKSDRFKYANIPAKQPTPVNAAPQQTSVVANGGEGIARIESDRSLNAIIVRDYEDAMPMYADLIAQLDKEPQLIEINVTIIDVDKNKLDELGVDWRYRSDDTALALGAATQQQGGFAQNGGLLLNTVLGSAAHQVLGRVRALAETDSAKVVSQPQIATLSNMEAVLVNDQSFYVRVAGAYEVDLFNVTVGTSLRVTPQVVGDPNNPQVKMVVTIEDGKITDNIVDDIPVVERSSLNTQAVIYDGESLLLGGLVKESDLVTTTKVPLLGDIPIAGNLFKHKNETNSKMERLFLIEPRILQSQHGQTTSIQQRDKTVYQ